MAARVQYTTVTVSYTDTLTEGGRGESGSTCTAHVLPVLHGYSDRGEVEESVAVRVQYSYCHSHCVLHRYSDRGSHLHCVWLLCHMIVI